MKNTNHETFKHKTSATNQTSHSKTNAELAKDNYFVEQDLESNIDSSDHASLKKEASSTQTANIEEHKNKLVTVEVMQLMMSNFAAAINQTKLDIEEDRKKENAKAEEERKEFYKNIQQEQSKSKAKEEREKSYAKAKEERQARDAEIKKWQVQRDAEMREDREQRNLEIRTLMNIFNSNKEYQNRQMEKITGEISVLKKHNEALENKINNQPKETAAPQQNTKTEIRYSKPQKPESKKPIYKDIYQLQEEIELDNTDAGKSMGAAVVVGAGGYGALTIAAATTATCLSGGLFGGIMVGSLYLLYKNHKNNNMKSFIEKISDNSPDASDLNGLLASEKELNVTIFEKLPGMEAAMRYILLQFVPLGAVYIFYKSAVSDYLV